ncbi:MAG: hypothetical protein P1U63_01550 [Coxiellaceae bacterium]|nr:hypothetical protein [Coxiellaceae bacterium]
MRLWFNSMHQGEPFKLCQPAAPILTCRDYTALAAIVVTFSVAVVAVMLDHVSHGL